MDPKAALEQAQSDLDDGLLNDCFDRLNDYYQWRCKGGFQPEGGDMIANDIAIALSEKMENML